MKRTIGFVNYGGKFAAIIHDKHSGRLLFLFGDGTTEPILDFKSGNTMQARTYIVNRFSQWHRKETGFDEACLCLREEKNLHHSTGDSVAQTLEPPPGLEEQAERLFRAGKIREGIEVWKKFEAQEAARPEDAAKA